ncbi:MAG: hypothetical protein AB1578_03470 [Thermodesulfobacteriota bacterium]
MRAVYLFGFSPEGEVQLSAFLARRGVFGEPLPGTACSPREALLFDGIARAQWVELLERWPERPPAERVAALFPPDYLPIFDAGLFPSWVSCVAYPRLEDYLGDCPGAEEGNPSRAPERAGCEEPGGVVGLVTVEVLGPTGARFVSQRPREPGERVTIHLAFRARGAVSLPAEVVSVRRRTARGFRCVASFAGAPAAARRSLVRHLSGRG